MKKIENLIKFKAHLYSSSFLPYEDLVQEGHEIILKLKNKYGDDYLYMANKCITNHFIDLSRKTRIRKTTCDIPEVGFESNFISELILDLSEQGQELVKIIFSEIVKINGRPNKEMIRKFLYSKKGWPLRKIQSTFNEITAYISA